MVNQNSNIISASGNGSITNNNLAINIMQKVTEKVCGFVDFAEVVLMRYVKGESHRKNHHW